jgi:hydrogenase/urease accessory protein HupE
VPFRPASLHRRRYALFLPGISTASALATIVQDGTVRSHVFTPENTTLTIARGDAVWTQAWSFFILGVKHILTGYDHVLFLITLLIAGGGLRALLKIVTAFTVAHSATLTLAVLDIVSLPSRVVESGIALSIAYVAAENLWRRERALTRRWLVTFGFGLIHGLGFASILRDLAVGGANLATSLVSFNLGVESGQILIVGVAFGLLEALRRATWQPVLRRALSAGAMVTGLVWFLQRAGGM